MMWWLLPLIAYADAPADRVDIDVRCGAVHITAGDLAVTGEAVVAGSERVRIRRSTHTDCGELHVQMPASARLSFDTVSASLSVAGLTGRIDFESVTGDLVVVHGDSVPTQVDAESVSGDLRVHVGEGAEVHLESVSGDLTVCGGPVAVVDAASMSSDVRVSVSTTPQTRIAVTTHSGDLTLALDRRPATLAVQTFSGRLVDGWSTGPGSKELRPAEPPGASVAASSFAGDIRLKPNDLECP